MFLSSLACVCLYSVISVGTIEAHDHYRSDASVVFAKQSTLKISDRSVVAQVKAAKAFIATLDDEKKKHALHEIDSDLRGEWTNIGTPDDEKGLRFGQMNDAQSKAALELLATVLGEDGYEIAWSVPLADDELLPAGKNQKNDRGYGVVNFTILIFGEPSVDQPWGIQFDGHHLVFNLTIHGDKMAMSPSFIGTRPSKFDFDGKEIKPLKNYADKAYDLMSLLDVDVKKQAVISKKKFNLRVGAGKDGVVPKPRGVKVSEFNDDQKKALMDLIKEYTATLPDHVAKLRNAELESEIDEMYFAWGGSTEKGAVMSYEIHGRTLIIEYASQGNTRNALDHIHAMYRNPTNEYGAKFIQPK